MGNGHIVVIFINTVYQLNVYKRNCLELAYVFRIYVYEYAEP
jgi:hypothetical protein